MAKIDLHEILDYIPNANAYLSSSKPYLASRCLFHTDSDPSMMVNESTYVCLSCGAHGRTSDLLKFLESGKIIPKQAPHYHSNLWTCLKDPDITVEDLAIEAHHRLMINPSNRYYLKKRGIDEKTIELLIGYYNGWYTFPILSKDYEITGMVARAGETISTTTRFRYMTPPSQPTMLYIPNWDLVEKSNYLVVVFGILDAISLSIVGVPALSFSQGHKTPVELLHDYRKKIYIIPDGDHKDDKATIQLCLNLGWRGKIVDFTYPDGGKDCNDILTKQGAKFLKDKLDNFISRDSIYKMRIKEEYPG